MPWCPWDPLHGMESYDPANDRAEEMAASVAAADARLEAQQAHRAELQQQLADARARAESAAQAHARDAQQTDAASVAHMATILEADGRALGATCLSGSHQAPLATIIQRRPYLAQQP